uniref:Uncharacterized protein n=1 Tax=Anguilla anguilla TaxID=7936 RepID=A0A0E9RFR9_ANGAN
MCQVYYTCVYSLICLFKRVFL